MDQNRDSKNEASVRKFEDTCSLVKRVHLSVHSETTFLVGFSHIVKSPILILLIN